MEVRTDQGRDARIGSYTSGNKCANLSKAHSPQKYFHGRLARSHIRHAEFPACRPQQDSTKCFSYFILQWAYVT